MGREWIMILSCTERVRNCETFLGPSSRDKLESSSVVKDTSDN